MNAIPLSRPKIGILALTLELYETLTPDLRRERERWLRKEVFPVLRRDVELVFEQAVYSKEGVDGALAHFESEKVDGLVVLFLTYAPSQILVGPLKRTSLPILVWNLQEIPGVDDSFTPRDMSCNHGVHGTQDLANVLLRSNVSFEYHTCHLSDENPTLPVLLFARAAMAVRRMRNMRVGLIGYPFPGMGDFAVDTTRLAAELGPLHTIVPIEEYHLRARDCSKEDAENLVSEYRASYLVDEQITGEELEWTARSEIAVRKIIKECRLDAFTYQFTAFGEDERTETLPFVATSRLLGEGIGFGGEGDILAAATTAMFHLTCPPTTFSEIFTIDFQGNSLFMSHMGECNIAMARKERRIPLAVRAKPITRTRRRQLSLITTLEPGPATFMVLAQGPERWRLIAALVEIPDFGPVAGFFVPHFKMIPRIDVREFLNQYARAGGPHHNALCFGDKRHQLRLLARLLKADYREIGTE